MRDEPTLRNRLYVTRDADGRALQQIGPYRIVRAIGEGGMGAVFLAEQDAPVRRNVAIKLIRSAFSRVEDRVRFQAEQQAMARLHHPNVAQIFEAGTTEEGYPFFAMEWLDGQEIADACDRRALSIEERLELFLGVCDGVQHAHQKGIVHRDLKPSNIIVVDIDGRAVPKIIDFGVAKGLDDPLVDAMTVTGDNIVGTPAYMSPEAVRGAVSGDLDTRADVYALGLILYKMLAGGQPYEAEDPLLDRMISIASVDIVTPRGFFRAMKPEERQAVAKRCATTPATLDRVLGSDLEAIVLEAVAKDREERYPSASELQADIRRWLAHEPVEASAPTTFDRMRKYAVRNRATVAAVLLIAFALVGGFVARTIEARRAHAARRQAELVTRFLTDLFDAGNPWNGEMSMHELLREGAKRTESQLVDAPLARAQVLQSIGSALMHQGDDELASKLLREALALRRKELGPDDPQVASTLVELGVLRQRYDLAEGELLLREAARIREKSLGPDDLWYANSLADLADVLRRRRKFGEAERLLLRSLAIREQALSPDDPLIAASLSGLGQVYRDAGQYDKAESALMRALQIRTKKYGPDHYVTSRSYDSISALRAAQGRWAEAEAYLRKDLAIVERVRGADHKYAAWVRVDLAETLVHQQRDAEARALLVRALPLLEHAPDRQDDFARGLAMLRAIDGR